MPRKGTKAKYKKNTTVAICPISTYGGSTG